MAITVDETDLQHEILRSGLELWERVREREPGVFHQRYWQARLLDRAMQDEDFKTRLLRLVDVLPALRDPRDVTEHAQEYLLNDGDGLPALLRGPLKVASQPLLRDVASRAIAGQVRSLARRFIAGRGIHEAVPALRRLHLDGVGFTADLLGEATLSFAEGGAYERRYLELIEVLDAATRRWPAQPTVDVSDAGVVPRANVSVKLSALDPALNPVDPEGGVKRLEGRLLPILLAARARNVFVNFDLEQWSLHEIAYDAFEALVMNPALAAWPHLGIVVQAYLRHSDEDIERLLALARRRGAPITLRLVKGAYWDYEQVRARQYGYPCPVFNEKAATDANYERLSVQLLRHRAWLRPAFASHNLRSLSHAVVQAERLGVPRSAYEIQMLYGMAEPERAVLQEQGHRVRVYAPIGELIPGMAYLVRRLLENTSNQGFLRQAHRERRDMRKLLQPPESRHRNGAQSVPGPTPAAEGPAPFVNCSFTDFTDPGARQQFAAAIEAVRTRLPLEVPVVVAGGTRHTGDTLQRECPSDTALTVARVTLATVEDVDRALETAMRAWPAWRERPVEGRAELLDVLADRLEADRARLAALQTFEVAKPWLEADADVAEAIDFCRYYARQACIELAPRTLGNTPGEANVLLYEGRGPAVVIAPWNFPLAILCGMSTAALVAGNPVVMKPAEQSSAVGYALYEHMEAAGFPPEVVQFLPGMGEVVGKRVVEHPLTATIAFTGSKSVGLAIFEQAARTQPGQPQIKRVICEMGGKNAVVVDSDADLDEAVAGVIQSTFGYAGQKCSACSRAVVVEEAYEPFVRRLVEAARSLLVRPAYDPGCQLGPVVDREAYDRLTSILHAPGPGVSTLYRGEPHPGGYYVPPYIVNVQDPDHRLMQEELFGPVLAVMQVPTFGKALEVAVRTPYALTGAVYSRNPSHLEQAARKFRAGNLYLNRASTGARVERQPFGGFGMSGAGTKAGGPNYLLNFADPRAITENTLRHGHAPELST